jgi:hypothetical protein
VVWAPRLHGEPGGPASITGTARFMPATFYIASLPFQDAQQIGGFVRGPVLVLLTKGEADQLRPVPDRGRSARLLARSAAASPGLAGVCIG